MLHGSLPIPVVLMKLEIKIFTGANKTKLIKLTQTSTVKNKYSILFFPKKMPCFTSKLLLDKESDSQEVTILP